MLLGVWITPRHWHVLHCWWLRGFMAARPPIVLEFFRNQSIRDLPIGNGICSSPSSSRRRPKERHEQSRQAGTNRPIQWSGCAERGGWGAVPPPPPVSKLTRQMRHPCLCRGCYDLRQWSHSGVLSMQIAEQRIGVPSSWRQFVQVKRERLRSESLRWVHYCHIDRWPSITANYFCLVHHKTHIGSVFIWYDRL